MSRSPRVGDVRPGNEKVVVIKVVAVWMGEGEV
jgi:hypothetical protein